MPRNSWEKSWKLCIMKMQTAKSKHILPKFIFRAKIMKKLWKHVIHEDCQKVTITIWRFFWWCCSLCNKHDLGIDLEDCRWPTVEKHFSCMFLNPNNFLTHKFDYTNLQNSIISFLYLCWFLAKNLFMFLSLSWKLHNRYCHNVAPRSLPRSLRITHPRCNHCFEKPLWPSERP